MKHFFKKWKDYWPRVEKTEGRVPAIWKHRCTVSGITPATGKPNKPVSMWKASQCLWWKMHSITLRAFFQTSIITMLMNILVYSRFSFQTWFSLFSHDAYGLYHPADHFNSSSQWLKHICNVFISFTPQCLKAKKHSIVKISSVKGLFYVLVSFLLIEMKPSVVAALW